MVFDCYVMNIIIFGTDRQVNKIDPVTFAHVRAPDRHKFIRDMPLLEWSILSPDTDTG